MANMHDIKHRIKSIKETRQITKAMKLISAAKLKKARLQLDQALPYFEKVKVTIADILMHSHDIDNPYFDLRHKKPVRRKAYIIITGDKGLAGAYNHNIIKLAEERVGNDKSAVLFIAGIMGRAHFLRKDFNVNPDFDYPVQNPTVYRARDIAEMILDLFKKGEIDEVDLIYTLMQSGLDLRPHFMKLLPLDLDALKEEVHITENIRNDEYESFIYEPSPAPDSGTCQGNHSETRKNVELTS